MRKLNDSYWDKYTYIDQKNKIIRDGIEFENLIEELLRIKYGMSWKRTGKSHDNNRDFHLTTTNYREWAECKNYKNSISMETIAPTLVMAQIFDVNKIIFFSYSEINRKAKEKIYSFAQKSEKEVEIFAGNTLDELIIKSRPYLPDKYTPLKEQINESQSCSEPNCMFRFIQTPTIGAVDDDKLALDINEVRKIIYNKAFEIDIICINDSLSDQYTLDVKADAVYGTDNDYFTVIDTVCYDIGSLHFSESIPAAGGIVLRCFFKSNIFCADLVLPVLRAVLKKNGMEVQTFMSPVQRVQNEWIGKTILVDERYRSLIKKAEMRLLNNDVISCLALYGVSGTGKTRLLQELSEVLLKNKYRIISFIGTEKESAFSALKEIVYFLYEIPRDEILTEMQNDSNLMETISKNPTANQAYLLVKNLKKAFAEQQIIEFIDNSFEIIFENLSQTKTALVIDNIQYFGKSFSYFIKKYLTYSKNQACKNTSVIFFSVNMDYITKDSKDLLEFIQELETDFYYFETFKVTGFKTENNGILFLRELLQLHDENMDNELKLILQKTSLRPYYIYQGIYYLLGKEAIQCIEDQKGYIISMDAFYDAVKGMPMGINKIIKFRWEMFLNKDKIVSETVELILSTLYLFRELSSDVIELLSLPKDVIASLHENMFLDINMDGNYCFDHDILEAFFSSYYPNLELPVLKQIQKYRLIRKLKNYLFVYNLCRLNRSNFQFSILKELHDTSLYVEIPLKLCSKYYERFLAVILKQRKIFPDTSTWIKYIQDICDLGKNNIGILQAEQLFCTANREIENSNKEDIISNACFRDYMNKYVDLLFYQRKHGIAIEFLLKTNQTIDESPKSSDDFYALKSMIYNRLYINYRELKSPECRRKAWDCLNESKKWAEQLEESALKDEFTYLNLSDEGYDFYCFQTTKEKLLSIWEQCKNYPPERLPKKAMNYYRKSIQLALLCQKPDKAFSYLSDAENFMITHSSSKNETLVFHLSFSLYKIMALIMEDPYKNNGLLMKEINYGYELSRFMAKKNWGDLLNLHGIVCYYQKDKDGVYYHYKEAYHAYNSNKTSLFYDERKMLLLENIVVAFSNLGLFEQAKEFLSAQDWEQIMSLKNTCFLHEASGIQRTSDMLLNLPCV